MLRRTKDHGVIIGNINVLANIRFLCSEDPSRGGNLSHKGHRPCPVS